MDIDRRLHPRDACVQYQDKIAAMQMPTDHVQRCQFCLESSVTGLSLLRFEESASILV
jgi:hypothetical protein